MELRRQDRTGVMMVAALAATIVLGLSACGSSDADSDATVPVTASGVTEPVVTEPATVETVATPVDTTPASTAPEAAPETSLPTGPLATDAPVQADGVTLVVTDAEVADLEKQLDEIDQLLAGIDADLSQD
jgi:hypothetical protein